MFVLALATGLPYDRPLVAESVEYRAIAISGLASIHKPYSERFLNPTVAALVARAGGIDIDRAFVIVAISALAILLICIATLLDRTTAHPELIVPLVFVPPLLKMVGLYYIQDLFYAAILSVFLVLLARERIVLAALAMLALYMTRESALILCLAVIVVGWMWSRRDLIWIAIAVIVLGTVATGYAGSLGLPNTHQMNEFAFVTLKIPFDAIRDFFGIILMPNTLRSHPGNDCVAIATVNLPKLIQAGDLRSFDVCRAPITVPLWTYSNLLAGFGVMPMVAGFILWRRGREIVSTAPSWLLVTLIYGGVTFVTAPMVGTWMDRMVGYGWPLFWIAVPALAATLYRPGRSATTLILSYSCVLAWIPWILQRFTYYGVAPMLIVIVIAIVAYAATLPALRRIDSYAEPNRETSAAANG